MPKPVRTDPQRHRTQMSESRLVWTTINRREFIALKEPDPVHPDLEQVWLDLRPKTGKFSLTAMTYPELMKFRELLLEAIDTAAPFCAELDRRAQEDYKKGNDVHARLYRTPAELFRHGNPNFPELPDDAGVQPRNDQSLQTGSDGAAEMDEG